MDDRAELYEEAIEVTDVGDRLAPWLVDRFDDGGCAILNGPRKRSAHVLDDKRYLGARRFSIGAVR